MIKNVSILFVVSCVVLAVSCSYNKTELPEPVVVVDVPTVPTPVTPTPNGITYTSHVKAIMDGKCILCHGSSGGVTLGTYAQVKAQADAGRILARVINGATAVNGPMPPLSMGGLLPQTTLDTLQMWLDQGSPQ